MERDKDFFALRPVGIVLALAFGGLLMALLSWNHRQFDGARIMGCYGTPTTPILIVSRDRLRSTQSGFAEQPIELSEDNHGYGFNIGTGLALEGAPTGYRLVRDQERSRVSIDTRKNGGTMALFTTDYREVDLPKVACPAP